MKVIVLTTFFLFGCCLASQRVQAIVSADSNVSEQKQYQTLTGIYEGYKSGIVRMLLPDGSRQGFLFSENLLRKISVTRIGERITITIEKGLIVSFERYEK